MEDIMKAGFDLSEVKMKSTEAIEGAVKRVEPRQTSNQPKRVWTETAGDVLYYTELNPQFEQLENEIYTLEIDQFGRFYLERKEKGFSFSYKVYGLETGLINRAIKTYQHTKGNLGVLLNGVKGTGKTVTSKILCNKLNLPVVMVTHYIKGCQFFLNSIPQDIIVFIDEYEKVFQDKSDMLTIMDGSVNSEHRRVFLLTTNELYVNQNLLQRPGRIRYLKTFSDLDPAITEEIIDDCLIHKHHKDSVLKFISNLELITVDIVKAVIEETNIHDEAPVEYEDVFNVQKITGRYDVFHVDDKKNMTPVKRNVRISPSYFYDEDNILGGSFYMDGQYIGRISEVVGYNTILVEHPEPKSKEDGTVYVTDTLGIPGRPSKSVFHIESADVMHFNYRFRNSVY